LLKDDVIWQDIAAQLVVGWEKMVIKLGLIPELSDHHHHLTAPNLFQVVVVHWHYWMHTLLVDHSPVLSDVG